MGWVNRWKGKYVKIYPKNPEALGECDDSGLTFNHNDLCKQMQWRGDSLVWTGLMVGRPYLDVPNEQDRPPLVKSDPKPIINPRPPTPYTDIENPVVAPFPQILTELGRESFYDDNTPPLGPPSYFVPNTNEDTPGWVEPNAVPNYQVLINQLRKINFQ